VLVHVASREGRLGRMTNSDGQGPGDEGPADGGQEPAKKQGDPLLDEVEEGEAGEGPGAATGAGEGTAAPA
jgi:hypothetical protein